MRAEGNIVPSLDVLCPVLGRPVSVAHSHLDFCPAATNLLLSQVFGASHVPFVMWSVWMILSRGSEVMTTERRDGEKGEEMRGFGLLPGRKRMARCS
jgi:hypothetical protein